MWSRIMPLCSTGATGTCGKEDITNSITCNDCAERDIVKVYNSETSKNAQNGYTRGKKHLDDLDRKIDASVMWLHCRLDHDSELQNFTMSVTGLHPNDCMLRQITEMFHSNIDRY